MFTSPFVFSCFRFESGKSKNMRWEWEEDEFLFLGPGILKGVLDKEYYNDLQVLMNNF